MRKALITGIDGQDGYYLSRLLKQKGYAVYGTTRKSPRLPDEKFDEIYHLASQGHTSVDFGNRSVQTDVTGIGALHILEGIRLSNSKAHFFYAGSSAMFGVSPAPHNENTSVCPATPYGCAKAYGYWLTKTYREMYGLHCSTGILYNHESPRRKEYCVSKKIATAAARIKLGQQKRLKLGEIESVRDWGYAPDYVYAMWLMTQQDSPDDYIIASGRGYPVSEILRATFEYFNLDWEKYVTTKKGEKSVVIGDSTKIKRMGWTPITDFYQMVKIMAQDAYENCSLE